MTLSAKNQLIFAGSMMFTAAYAYATPNVVPNPAISYANAAAQPSSSAPRPATEDAKQKLDEAMKKLTPEQRGWVKKTSKQILDKMMWHFIPPNPSLTSPNAMGGKGRVAFGSLSYVSHWNGTTVSDGFGVVGGSLGDPFRYVGAMVSLDIDSLGLRQDKFGQNSAVGFRINRYIFSGTSVAFGAGNAVGWGVFQHSARNYYVAATQFLPLALPVTVNAGFGSGAFYSTYDAKIGKNDQYRPFAGVGVGVYKDLSLIVDWTTQQFSTGGTYNFTLMNIPFFVSAAAASIGGKPHFTPHLQLSLGAAYQFT